MLLQCLGAAAEAVAAAAGLLLLLMLGATRLVRPAQTLMHVGYNILFSDLC
jgi:hypothetical protein